MRSVLRSRDNPKVKRWAKLVQDGRLRRKEGRVLVEGPHLVQAALQAGLKPHAVIVSERGLGEFGKLHPDPVILADRVFAGIVDAENPPGIAAEISLPSARSTQGDVVFLEGVQDPGNVGAIMRSAAALGVVSVVLDQGCADPWSPKTLRAGMGAHFAMQISTVPSLAKELAGFSGRVVATVPRGGVDLRTADLGGRIGWLLGAEGQGLSEASVREADLKVTIPMAGAESLNVAAAAAICFYAAFSTRAEGS